MEDKRICGTCKRGSREGQRPGFRKCTFNRKGRVFRFSHQCGFGKNAWKSYRIQGRIPCIDGISPCNPGKRSGKECMGCGG